MVSKPRSLKQIPKIGSALVALLALGALLAPASALASGPVNKTLPVASPSTPEVGKTETTSNGEWKPVPTSYLYAWYRCNAAGAECVTARSVSESPSYVPVAADRGHTLVAEVRAYSGVDYTAALSKPTSLVPSGGPLHWYACKKTAEFGMYEDASSTKEGGTKAYGWKKLTTPTSFVLGGSAPFAFTFSLGGGLTATITCTSHTAEGTIANPAGETEAGTISVSKSLFLSSCVVTGSQEIKCKLYGGTIQMLGLNTEVTEFGEVKFSQAASNLFAFSFTECKAPGLNQRWEVFGNFTGTLNNATSSLEFTQASSVINLSNGGSGYFAGSTKIETKAGEALKLAP